MKLTAQDIEVAVANHFGYRRNVIVPNVSWGLGLAYEADLVVLRPSNWAAEVEIKISASDIKRDLKKYHQHDNALFCELWFAVPESLKDHPDIPERAGVLSVKDQGHVCVCRRPQRRKDAIKFPDYKRQKLYELGLMRVWKLKQALSRLQKEEKVT